MKTIENQQRIRKISRRLGLFFHLCIYLLPLIPAICWFWYNDLPQVMHENIFPGKTIDWLPLNSRLIALAGNLPATFIMVLAVIIMLIGMVIDEGRKIHEEVQLTI